eukprot:2381902-Amphidinium_carterae.1
MLGQYVFKGISLTWANQPYQACQHLQLGTAFPSMYEVRCQHRPCCWDSEGFVVSQVLGGLAIGV